ncbi:3'-5' exoribonuclease [Mesorhizobium sp. STM 4661]|uniref:3'-5' exoribonuclease domain-containing protein n=1 Tax=Mesorhizobium sp. STM 4661 TaxID=1297570 RepID=UPI0012F75F17|nr:3'-5' exoribonuclease [Mesorhizobium sp. STM 4661]
MKNTGTFCDVMCDIETGGTRPDHAPILQIAAVKFNLAEKTVDTTSMFDRCLLIPPGRYWDESTRQWWGEQKRSILQDIYPRMEDPRTVMQAFADWAGYSPIQPLRFWAKPTSFDFSFVASYFTDFEIMNPFHFRFATDMNSYIRGMAGDSSLPTFKTDFVGDAHNAIYDTINQIDAVFKATEHFKS